MIVEKTFLIIIFFLMFSCGGNEKIRNKEPQSNAYSNDSLGNNETVRKLDTLTRNEKSFLYQIAKENESLIVSAEVERFYARSDNIPLVSKLTFPKELLIDSGYVYLEIEFYGNISDVNISYRYSLGHADTGYGTVTGDGTDNYLHTYKGCGVTACITQVYQNGKKIFEKEDQ